MKAVSFVVPGDLATPTGGYTYDRRIIAGLDALGWRVELCNIGDGFPRPSPQARAAARRALAVLTPDAPIVIDGLAFGVMPEEARSLGTTHRLVALVHHPLAYESGLSDAERTMLCASERAALACVRHVIVTSPSTGRLLGEQFGVPSERLSVVPPGTDRVAPPPHKHDGGAVSLLAVGSVVPRKGYDLLVGALARLTDLPWRLVIAGDRSRSPETARQLEAEVERRGLHDRITLAGAVGAERLAQLYAGADLFVLPSRFEGYGMAYAEAIAAGLPVVATRAGAIAETVPPGAGVLVEPDDAAALERALRPLIASSAERERLAAGARAAATSFPSWRDSAEQFAGVLERIA